VIIKPAFNFNQQHDVISNMILAEVDTGILSTTVTLFHPQCTTVSRGEKVMNDVYINAFILFLLLHIQIAVGNSRYTAVRLQHSFSYIHLRDKIVTTRIRPVLLQHSSSIDNVNSIINTDYTTNDVRQWEKWQIGQGNLGIMNKYSLKEWLNGTFYEQYWDTQLPTIVQSSLMDEKDIINQQSIVKVDGHDFFGRMAIYKFLIQDWEEMFPDTGTSLVQLWGSPVHESHWLWSYAAQLDWQHRSMRLSEPILDSDSNEVMKLFGRISPSSWWGYMNFCFSVAVLIGAMNTANKGGSNYQVQLDEESQRLLQEDSACQKCVLAWEQLFSSVYPEYKERLLALDEGELDGDKLQLLRFEFQQEIWKTHTSIIETALHSSRSNMLLKALPQPERKFGLGWARMVDILAATTFPTDLVSIVKDGTGFLPFHVVTDKVVTEWNTIDKSKDSSRSFSNLCHQRAVETTHRLADLDDNFFHLVVKFWRRIVRDVKASRNMPSRVNRLVHGSWLDKVVEFGKVMILFLRP
jgi:hypothetical protein